MNQNEMIMRYLEENGSITQLDAMSEFGCMRLASRISDLRHNGVKIKKTMDKARNRYGVMVSFARYTLEE